MRSKDVTRIHQVTGLSTKKILLKYVPFSRGDNGYMPLKLKLQSD